MSVQAVSGKRDTTSVQAPPTFTLENGNVVINFNGKKQELSKKQAEEYFKTFYNLNHVRNVIDNINEDLKSTTISANQRFIYETNLEIMKKQLKRQQEFASYEISPTDATITFTIKKDINAEEFKELFFLVDGSLRESLTQETLAYGKGKSKGLFSDASDIQKPYHSYKEAKSLGVSEFPNGVTIEYNEKKKRWEPNYTQATLAAGNTYTVKGHNVDPLKDLNLIENIFGWSL